MNQFSFKDYFSAQAKKYATFRPCYPQQLFDFLFSIVSETQLAWDCATGNGQVAIQLSEKFKEVVATDASENQIKNAIESPGINYKVEPAEKTSLKNSSVDLITVGQALHWFYLNAFYKEAERVLKPGGIIAAWTYEHFTIPGIPHSVLLKYHDEILNGFWPEERKLVGKGYHNLPFPFKKINVPQLQMKHQWTLPQLLGYLESWSGAQRFVEDMGYNPVEDIKDEFLSCWGNQDETKEIFWEIDLLAGRNEIKD